MIRSVTFPVRGALAALALALPLNLAADDWPQWRGPNRDAKSAETGLLSQWPDDGPALAWKVDGLGGGYATPVVANGRVFGAGYFENEERVWARDAATGAPLWSVRATDADRGVGYGDGPRSSPTIDGDHLYTLSAGGVLSCLETAGGRIVWQRNLKTELDGRMMSGWGYSESPLVDGDQVVCMPGARRGTVAAFDKAGGKLVWQSRDLSDKAPYTSIIRVTIDSVPQYIVFTDEHVAGLDPASGDVLWKADRDGKTAVIPTPIHKDNLVWVTSGYNVGCNLFEVTRSGGRFRAREVYANNDIENHHGGPILVGDHVYSSSGPVLVCMELATGKVAWKARSAGKGSLAYADGHLYLRGENGPIALVEANPDRYVEKGRFDQPDRSDKRAWPHPVIANGRLYLRDMDILLCYELARTVQDARATPRADR